MSSESRRIVRHAFASDAPPLKERGSAFQREFAESRRSGLSRWVGAAVRREIQRMAPVIKGKRPERRLKHRPPVRLPVPSSERAPPSAPPWSGSTAGPTTLAANAMSAACSACGSGLATRTYGRRRGFARPFRRRGRHDDRRHFRKWGDRSREPFRRLADGNAFTVDKLRTP